MTRRIEAFLASYVVEEFLLTGRGGSGLSSRLAAHLPRVLVLPERNEAAAGGGSPASHSTNSNWPTSTGLSNLPSSLLRRAPRPNARPESQANLQMGILEFPVGGSAT